MLELQMPGVRRVTKLEVSSLYSPPPMLAHRQGDDVG